MPKKAHKQVIEFVPTDFTPPTPPYDIDTELQVNRSIYLLPEQLTPNEANDKARPDETPEQREIRVIEMAKSIRANGQQYPVLVVEVSEGESLSYEYVDGGGRVDAIGRLNEDAETGNDVRKIWCTVVGSDEDLFRKAIVGNLHRTQNSIIGMAMIVREAKERNGWKGHGAGKKVAEYLGIGENRVSEYETMLSAPDWVQEKIRSGQIASLDAALKLLAIPEEKQEEVATRAAEIAEEEQSAQEEKEAETESTSEATTTEAKKKKDPDWLQKGTVSKKPNVPKAPVKARHITEAARSVGAVTNTPRGKSDAIALFQQITAAAYPAAAVKFADHLTEKWFAGMGTDKEAIALFDRAVGAVSGKTPVKKAETKPAKAKTKTVAKKVAAKTAKKKK